MRHREWPSEDGFESTLQGQSSSGVEFARTLFTMCNLDPDSLTDQDREELREYKQRVANWLSTNGYEALVSSFDDEFEALIEGGHKRTQSKIDALIRRRLGRNSPTD